MSWKNWRGPWRGGSSPARRSRATGAPTFRRNREDWNNDSSVNAAVHDAVAGVESRCDLEAQDLVLNDHGEAQERPDSDGETDKDALAERADALAGDCTDDHDEAPGAAEANAASFTTVEHAEPTITIPIRPGITLTMNAGSPLAEPIITKRQQLQRMSHRQRLMWKLAELVILADPGERLTVDDAAKELDIPRQLARDLHLELRNRTGEAFWNKSDVTKAAKAAAERREEIANERSVQGAIKLMRAVGIDID